jgi:hypothetical protein
MHDSHPPRPNRFQGRILQKFCFERALLPATRRRKPPLPLCHPEPSMRVRCRFTAHANFMPSSSFRTFPMPPRVVGVEGQPTTLVIAGLDEMRRPFFPIRQAVDDIPTPPSSFKPSRGCYGIVLIRARGVIGSTSTCPVGRCGFESRRVQGAPSLVGSWRRGLGQGASPIPKSYIDLWGLAFDNGFVDWTG